MFASERRICLPLWDDLEECWVILGCYKASIRRDLENHKRLGYLWMPVFCSSDGHRLIVSTCPSCQRSQSLRSLSRIAAFTVLCKSIPLRHDHHLLPGQPSFDQNLNDMKPLFAPTYFLCIKLQMLCCKSLNFLASFSLNSHNGTCPGCGDGEPFQRTFKTPNFRGDTFYLRFLRIAATKTYNTQDFDSATLVGVVGTPKSDKMTHQKHS